jgi:hypothetical protein
MTCAFSPNLQPFDIYDKPEARPYIVEGRRGGPAPRRTPKIAEFPVIVTHVSRRYQRTHANSRGMSPNKSHGMATSAIRKAA